MERLNMLRGKCKEFDADAVLVTNPFYVRYFSGFTGSAGQLFVSQQRCVMITDFRYKEQAAEECHGFEVLLRGNRKYSEIIKELSEADAVKTLGFDEQHVCVAEYERLTEIGAGKQLLPMQKAMEACRMVKDLAEINLIRKAVDIGDKAFEHILGFLKPGRTELEVAIELEFFMRRNGAERLSFDSIVASGIHSSKPHASPDHKKLEKGDLVTMDFGCVYEGYCSDMTRTIVIGQASLEQKKIYDIVLQAQLRAIDCIRAGLSGKEIDDAARSYISDQGYGSAFGHGLGHAVGLEVHEAPSFSPLCDTTIEENMIMTVEPGIYVEGFGGVRIEDMGAVKSGGFDNFTKSPKSLMVI